MAKKKKEDKEEKEEKETPVMDFGLNFGGLFKGLGDFMDMATKLAQEGQSEIQRTGELSFDKAKKLRGMYGVSVRVGRGGRPVIDKFGTVTPTPTKEIKPEEGDVREPLVDVFEQKDRIIVTAELPGVEEKNIKTKVKGKTLTISAESKDRKYSKEIELPSEVTTKIESTYKNGVLDIKLKKKK